MQALKQKSTANYGLGRAYTLTNCLKMCAMRFLYDTF